jgi:predicted AAA+ superfamily ATPase
MFDEVVSEIDWEKLVDFLLDEDGWFDVTIISVFMMTKQIILWM